MGEKMPLKSVARKVIESDEAQVATIKAAGGGMVYGVTLNDWVAIATFIYFVLQIAFLIRREIKGRKDESNKK